VYIDTKRYKKYTKFVKLQETFMEKEKIFSEKGRDMTKTYLELAAELSPSERDRFIDMMEGTLFALRCSRKKEKASLLQQ
jgi:chromosome condensin MukBEF complex kleisin-like MukF subunit